MTEAAAGLHQVARNAWLWVAHVPWLPDVAADSDRIDSSGLRAGYAALAETIAGEPVDSCALQFRLAATPAGEGSIGLIRVDVLVRAASARQASRLGQLVRACLPPQLPLVPVVDPETVRAMIGPDDPAARLRTVVAVRRRVEEIAVVPGVVEGDVLQPAVLLWAPDAGGLHRAVPALARHTAPATVLLHAEPAQPDAEVLATLQATVRAVSGDDADANPLRLTVGRQYRRRLRDLPRAALDVQVQITSSAQIEPGLAESVGLALTDEDSFELVRASSDTEVLLADELRTLLRSRPWRRRDEGALDGLLRLASVAEAAAVVRLPDIDRGGMPGIASRVVSTLPRVAQEPIGRRVLIGLATGGGEAAISTEDLNQHLLVAGLPGFGKSVTTQSLLVRLHEQHGVPFLVLDPAKSDYAALRGPLGGALRHVQLSPSAPAFNPFGVPDGVSRHTHAGRVLAAFDTTFRLSDVWPAGYVTLARGIFHAYDAAGEATPDLSTLEASLRAVIAASGFSGSSASDIRAALLGRIEFLRNGPLGAALDRRAGDLDHAALLNGPAVVEMREFGGPVERSLVFALLLAGVISYREVHPVGPGLGHVTVVEEAHRLLGAAPGGAGEGIRLFVEAIAELRGSGEGFVIVDQAPTRLDQGVLKLCGSTIAHRLVDRDERERIGAATLLDERQQVDLARLARRQAVVFTASSEAATTAEVLMHPGLGDPADRPVAVTALPWRTPRVDGRDLIDRVREARAAGVGIARTRQELQEEAVHAHAEDPGALLERLRRIEIAIGAVRDR